MVIWPQCFWAHGDGAGEGGVGVGGVDVEQSSSLPDRQKAEREMGSQGHNLPFKVSLQGPTSSNQDLS
jgi:hypothetical protein